MARKKPPEEHENLERWLVSYADFMTLLFATFVVLYALAQSDVNSFKGIEEALRKAFSQNIFDNQSQILDGSESIFKGESGATNPLMLEYMSQKYEQVSYEDIENDVNDLKSEGISTQMTDRGLVIRLNDHAVQFKAGTADLTDKSKEILNKVSKIIKDKFSIHYIQVEGHADNDKVSNKKLYPSNWELSSARASSVTRYMIENHNFNPKIFTVVGLADTVPIVPNTTPDNKAKNRRVEIVIMKNKFRNLSDKNIDTILKEVQLENKKNALQIKTLPYLPNERQVGNDKELFNNSYDLKTRYKSEVKRLDNIDSNDKKDDSSKPEFME